jgi:hypothetical protein
MVIAGRFFIQPLRVETSSILPIAFATDPSDATQKS